MNGFFVGSPVLPIITTTRKRSTERRVSDPSDHTLAKAPKGEPSLKSRTTSSSKDSKSSSGSRRRLNRLRRFFSFKKQDLDYEKMDESEPKKSVKKHDERDWDRYYLGMQYGCWF